MELNFPKLEKKILKYWKENKTFEKSVKQRAKSRNFVFYEGPPTANAKPGTHHVLSRIYKDIICRYKTMRGFRVLRKAGWDTHGLPVELEIEKKLGLRSKKDIEKYGIDHFNKKCRESVWVYKTDWEKLTERIGFWLNMENPYITYQPDYIETVWWIIKQISKKGLIYQDYKVVPYCPRCGTSLSSHEVALGYKKIKEPAIYIKFKIKDLRFKNSYLLVWTTTPWTLPGNVAIAVNPEFLYAKVKTNNEYLILAKERIEACGIKGKIIQEFKGKDLIDLNYRPLYPSNYQLPTTGYKVISGDFISLEEGTGLVHIAPAFGEEDMEAIKNQNSKIKSPRDKFPVLITVNKEGEMKTPKYRWDKMYVKNADPLIILDLKKRNLLFKEELYEHDYPFCWRCSSPLLYYAKQNWFINMQKVKKDLIKNNQKINWTPSYLKEGRFGEWLREIKDWVITRERYWGTPLPIWRCKGCGNLEVIGSKNDLLSQKFSENRYFIIRHGESQLQTKYKRIVCGWLKPFSIFLTRKGKKDIEAKAKKLQKEKIDLIYASDFLRTATTAQIIAKKLGLKVIFDKRLRDINWGVYIGRKVEEFFKKFPHSLEKFKKGPQKGESWNACRKRILDFMKDIDKKHRNKTILIVSHGDPLWLLDGTMRGLKDEELLKQKIQGKTIKVGEIRKINFKNLPYNQKGELDFHRPFIDGVKFYCKKCQGLMERVPEVLDCWFDSGSMPLAQYHYPFENKNLIDKKNQFPANYISEAVDQTRGWFYTLLAISTLLGFEAPYKNVISLGHVLDEKGEKMSKSKGNVVEPRQILEKYGADAVRWYFFTVNQPGDVKLFSEKEIEQTLKRFIITLWNCYLFYQTYVTPFKRSSKIRYKKRGSRNVLDRWIISRLNGLIQQVTENLDKYDVTFAARSIENFVIEDLSLWYIRRSRKRFRPVTDYPKAEKVPCEVRSSLRDKKTSKDFKDASATLNFALLTLSRLTAPFIPFLNEEIYQKLGNKKSVHLEEWPRVNKKLINKKLNQEMERTRQIVTLALAERAKSRIKVRQPLNELQITNLEFKKEPGLLELVREEVNVKKITFGKKIKLDTKITSALKEEGIIREVIRQIQEMRKKVRLKPRHKILVRYSGETSLGKILARNANFILKETKAKGFQQGEQPGRVFDIEREIKVDHQKLWLAIKKI